MSTAPQIEATNDLDSTQVLIVASPHADLSILDLAPEQVLAMLSEEFKDAP